MFANKLGIPHYAKPFALAAAATLFATVAMGDYLGETGGYVTTTAQPAFQNVSLSEIGNAYLIKARMAGAWINAEVRGNPAYVANFTTGEGFVRCEAMIRDGDDVKCVVLKFTQNGDDVYVQALNNGNATYVASTGKYCGNSFPNANGSKIAAAPTADGYGVYDLKLVNVKKPLATAVNPVTRQSQSFDYVFTGIGDAKWATLANWSPAAALNDKVPCTSSSRLWDAALIHGDNIADPSHWAVLSTGTGDNVAIEGWNLKIGAFGGAKVTIDNLVKIQGGQDKWMMVDADSQIVINNKITGALGAGNTDARAVINYYVAAPAGIVFDKAFPDNGTNNKNLHSYYYLTGDGYVQYNGALTKGNDMQHHVKQADFTLKGTASAEGRLVRSKKLIGFASATGDGLFTTGGATVTATNAGDATVSRKANDAELDPESDAVGTYRIYQASNGIYLEYVDYMTAQDFTWNCYGTVSGGTWTGGTPSGWLSSFEQAFSASGPFCFGPTASATYAPMVDASHRPYANLSSRDAYTLLLYADIEEAPASSVLLTYGKKTNDQLHALVKTSTGAVKLMCFPNSTEEAGVGITTSETNYKGYHLYAITYDKTAGQKLYVDGELIGENPDATAAPYVSGGLQIGSGFAGMPTGYSKEGVGMAVMGVYGYNTVLSKAEIVALAQKYPASKSYTFSSSDFNYNAGTLETHFHDCTATEYAFGGTNGKLVIPAGCTVKTKCYKFLNSNETSNNIENDIYGTVWITSSSDNAQIQASKIGVLFGHWKGTGTYNIKSTGLVDCSSAYFMTCYSAGDQTITIDGGTVKTKGFSCYQRDGGTTKLILRNGGTIEVSECLTVTNGSYVTTAFTQEYGNGTIKFTGNAKTITAPQAASFTDSENGTVIDVNGNNVTFSGALSGNGKIIFKDTAGTGSITLSGTVNVANIVFDGVAAKITGTVESGEGTILALDAGTTLVAGQKLLSTAGTGTINLSGVTIGGTPVQGITWSRKTDGPDGDGIYIDTVATTTGEGAEAVTTVSAAAWQTSAAVALSDAYAGTVVVPPQVATLTGAGVTTDNVKVKYNGTDITGAFTIGGSAGNVTIALNPEGAVGEVPVRPVPVDASPVTFGDGTTPSYTVKAIPGLWYKVRSGTALNGTELGGTMADGVAVQANDATVSPVAPAFPSEGALQYHKIAVDTTK